MAAASALALGAVPLLASAAAARVESESEVFQLARIDRLDQDADARSGQNDAWNEINQSGTGNTASGNMALIDAGDSKADNQTDTDVFLWAESHASLSNVSVTYGDGGSGSVESESEVKQIARIDIDQDADARSGQNDAWNEINQSGTPGTNTASGNTASITTGDSYAWNVDDTDVNQHTKSSSELSNVSITYGDNSPV